MQRHIAIALVKYLDQGLSPSEDHWLRDEVH